MMVLGFVLHKTPLLSDNFAGKLNDFVFKAALPVQLFQNLAESDFYSVWDGEVVLFCLGVSLLSVLIALAVSFLWKNKSLRAEFTQTSYRSSIALLGAALMQNIYGTTGPLSLIILGSVPLYNVAAVILLTLMTPGSRLNRQTLLKAVKGIVTNPIIIGVVVGLLWSVLRIPEPTFLSSAVSMFAATATPLGLIALGASINLKQSVKCLKPAVVSSVFKLILFVAAFTPLAILMGCRGEVLVAILIMLGSPTTVTCFTMARSMGHEGTLSASTVMITTICSAFTFTFWLYLLKSLGLV